MKSKTWSNLKGENRSLNWNHSLKNYKCQSVTKKKIAGIIYFVFKSTLLKHRYTILHQNCRTKRQKLQSQNQVNCLSHSIYFLINKVRTLKPDSSPIALWLFLFVFTDMHCTNDVACALDGWEKWTQCLVHCWKLLILIWENWERVSCTSSLTFNLNLPLGNSEMVQINWYGHYNWRPCQNF